MCLIGYQRSNDYNQVPGVLCNVHITLPDQVIWKWFGGFRIYDFLSVKVVFQDFDISNDGCVFLVEGKLSINLIFTI